MNKRYLNWKVLMVLIMLSVFPLISAYEIICIEGDGGVKIWEDVNLSQNYTKKIALELLMKTEEFENCTFTETPEEPDGRIIGMLNNNILERNEEIKKLKGYRIWMYIFMVMTILLVIREGWLWLKK